MHLFVLEGLRNGGVQYMWKSLPKPENSGKVRLLKFVLVAAVVVLYLGQMCNLKNILGPLNQYLIPFFWTADDLGFKAVQF